MHPRLEAVLYVGFFSATLALALLGLLVPSWWVLVLPLLVFSLLLLIGPLAATILLQDLGFIAAGPCATLRASVGKRAGLVASLLVTELCLPFCFSLNMFAVCYEEDTAQPSGRCPSRAQLRLGEALIGGVALVFAAWVITIAYELAHACTGRPSHSCCVAYCVTPRAQASGTAQVLQFAYHAWFALLLVLATLLSALGGLKLWLARYLGAATVALAATMVVGEAACAAAAVVLGGGGGSAGGGAAQAVRVAADGAQAVLALAYLAFSAYSNFTFIFAWVDVYDNLPGSAGAFALGGFCGLALAVAALVLHGFRVIHAGLEYLRWRRSTRSASDAVSGINTAFRDEDEDEAL
eukprot:TRINITY_DN3743_c0_g1_i2.p1 TRINITY_DN3743_c0_g1~~TRINITY_DN3743_c0_g1_i2.p1  ORF type:complete len:352 (+),score=89.08 TRINITY_DN3743_c0_g1_i2:154-1209(+)